MHSKSGVYSKYPDPTARMNVKSHNVYGPCLCQGQFKTKHASSMVLNHFNLINRYWMQADTLVLAIAIAIATYMRIHLLTAQLAN